MFSKHSFHILKLLVVVFPVAAGLFLTSLGVAKLNQATETPISKPLAWYGILAFSSEKFDMGASSLALHLDIIKMKENWVLGKFVTTFDFLSPSKEQTSSHEVTFGFQIPYNAEPMDHWVWAFTKLTNSRVELEILDKNVIFVGNYSTSIIYLKFVAQPEFTLYEVVVRFHWRDFIIKQGFSTYEIIVPFSQVTLNVAHTYLPNVHPVEFLHLTFGMHLPSESEIRETFPPPTAETMEVHGGTTTRFLQWSLGEWTLYAEALSPGSKLVRVRLELLEEHELRGRLMFDSGLYMGLGVGLVFSGIHEALKIATELRKKRKE